MKRRHIFASRDVYTKMKVMKTEALKVYSFFPVDPHTCECQGDIEAYKEHLRLLTETQRNDEIERLESFVCARDKTGMKRYEIRCNNCNQIQGYLWATDKKIVDWCDFHYSQWTDGGEWYGCLTPNISPIDGKLGFECTCGNDSRDFRANMTLPAMKAAQIEASNKEGREFDSPGAKFTARVIQDNMKPRIETEISDKVVVDRPSSK